MNLPDAAIGSIIAAAIAGLVVFVSTVLTKEQKTSEFRQVWIDEIRNDISHYIAGVVEVVSMVKYKKGGKEEYQKFIDDNFSAIQNLSTLEHRIILRLNPEEHKSLISEIRSFRSAMIDAYEDPVARKSKEDALIEKLTIETKKILSDEWKRVKTGEPTFRFVKGGALLLIAGVSIILILNFFNTRSVTHTGKSTSDEPKIYNQIIQFNSVSPEDNKLKKHTPRSVQNNLINYRTPVHDIPASIPVVEK